MGRRVTIIAAVGVALALAMSAGVLLLKPFGPDDPDSARCDNPPTNFGDVRNAPGHRELEVRYTCEGAAQSATIYLPLDEGQHPAVIWVHGAGEATRIVYDYPVFTELVRNGVAVLTYDKRGVGQSEGACCPGDEGHFNLLTADVEGAMVALRSRPEIDGDRIGLMGASQAGWIAPRAAVEKGAAFLALASAPTVGERVANLYERLSSGAEGDLSRAEIADRLGKSEKGFDPLPDLQRLDVPGLWMFGTADDRTPVDESKAVLDRLKADGHDITVVVYPDAGHGLLDTPPTAPDAPADVVRWILDHTASR